MQRQSYKPFERQKFHHHDDTRIIVVLSGGFREQGFGAAGMFSRGDVIIRPVFAGHSDWASASGATYIQFRAAPNLLTKQIHSWRSLRGGVDLSNPRVWQMLTSSFAAEFLAEQVREHAYELMESADPLDISARSLAAAPAQNLKRLAMRAGMRADSFSKAFKRKFSVSPRSFAKSAQLERAMEMVAQGGASLADVAASCGYYDQSHLCRAFRRRTGVTPLQFSRMIA